MPQATRTLVLQYAEETWGDTIEYPWDGDDVDGVLRHPINRKWYALLMQVDYSRLGLIGDGKADILNIKADPLVSEPLLHRDGFLPAYHMNKRQWLTILLDGRLDMGDVVPLLDMSHHLTDKKTQKIMKA